MCLVSARIRTYLALVLVCQIAADAAVPEVLFGADDSISKDLGLSVRKAKNMKSEPLSCLSADARKLA